MLFDDLMNANPKLNIRFDDTGEHAPIVLRGVKGEELTHEEMDANILWMLAFLQAFQEIMDMSDLFEITRQKGSDGVHLTDVFEHIKIDWDKVAGRLPENSIDTSELAGAIRSFTTSTINGILNNQNFIDTLFGMNSDMGFAGGIDKLVSGRSMLFDDIGSINPNILYDGIRIIDKGTKKTLTYFASDKKLYDAMGSVEYDLSGNA